MSKSTTKRWNQRRKPTVRDFWCHRLLLQCEEIDSYDWWLGWQLLCEWKTQWRSLGGKSKGSTSDGEGKKRNIKSSIIFSNYVNTALQISFFLLPSMTLIHSLGAANMLCQRRHENCGAKCFHSCSPAVARPGGLRSHRRIHHQSFTTHANQTVLWLHCSVPITAPIPWLYVYYPLN